MHARCLIAVAVEDGHEAWHYWISFIRPFVMLDVFDYLLQSFHDTTDWNDDNFYSNLTAVSRSLSSYSYNFLPSGTMRVDNRDRFT